MGAMMTRIAISTVLAVLLLSHARGEEQSHKRYFECGKQWVMVSENEDGSHNVTFWKMTRLTPRFGMGDGNMGFMNGKPCREKTEDEFNCATAESRIAARAFGCFLLSALDSKSSRR
jgi:hypothetical protein